MSQVASEVKYLTSENNQSQIKIIVIDEAKLIASVRKIDPYLGSIFDRLGILNLLRFKKKPYPALIAAIIGQIITFKQAGLIRKNLYTRFGTDFTHNDMSKTSDKEFSQMGMNSSMIEKIRSVNRYTQLHHESSVDDWIQISGIGQWTIEVVRLTINPYVDIFPCGDRFLQNKIWSLYQLAKRPTPKEVKQISDKWKGYRGLVCWYLWCS